VHSLWTECGTTSQKVRISHIGENTGRVFGTDHFFLFLARTEGLFALHEQQQSSTRPKRRFRSYSSAQPKLSPKIADRHCSPPRHFAVECQRSRLLHSFSYPVRSRCLAPSFSYHQKIPQFYTPIESLGLSTGGSFPTLWK